MQQTRKKKTKTTENMKTISQLGNKTTRAGVELIEEKP